MATNNSHHSTLTEAEKRARDLEAILRASKTIASSLDLDHTLSLICRAAVKLLDVSHSSLVLLSPGHEQGKVCAEYPEIGVRDLIISFGGAKEYKQLGVSTEPVFIPDVSNASELGAIRKSMLDLNIQSILIVPVVSEDRLLGYFSLDTIGHTRSYTDEEIDLCKIFAAQVSVAIKYEETKQRAEQLEALRQTTLAITSMLERDELLSKIIEQAARLLKAKYGGIFEYYPGHQELTVIAGQHKGTTLRVGEGMAGQLVLSGEPFMIVDNYEEWAERAPVEFGKRPSGAVLEVPLRWQEQPIGFLYVEDEVPRKFTEEDAQLLTLFADQAAIAMESTRLVKELRERQENLASLIWAAQSLSGKLNPARVLKMIAEQARKFLKGDSVTIWPYDKGLDKFLPADLVTVGIPEAELQEFKGQDPPPGGISRAVMREGWLDVPDVVAADYQFMRSTPRTELLTRMGIKSFQGVALKVGNEPVGVMYVNYNQPRRFTDEDRHSMETLAEQVALALVIVRNAQLSEERQQKLYEQASLVELSKQLLGTVGREEILKRAVAMARRVLKTDCCNIVLPDKEGRLLFVAQEGWENVEVGKTEMERGRKSQTGYIIETGKPSRVSDYEKQEEFVPPKEIAQNRIKSGMGVPMRRESEVIGAMLVHSRTHRLFTDAEENLLSLIANQTTIALHSAEQYEELEKTKKTVEASTALALMGMSSGVWAHSIRGHAINIRELVDMMRQKLDLPDDQLSAMREEFGEKFARLERQATKILEKPLADPLLSEKGVGSFSIREILEGRITYLLRNETYRQVTVVSKLDAVDKSVTVRCNPEWLKRALDILFDNAVKAMKEVEPARQSLTVSADLISDVASREMVEIAVADTGPGIPLDLRDKFLKTRIDKIGDDSRSGVGLLMARTIVEAYGGKIELKHTGKEGTTIVIKLPISES